MTTAAVTAAYLDADSQLSSTSGFRRLVGLHANYAPHEDRAIGVVAVGRRTIADCWDKVVLLTVADSTSAEELLAVAASLQLASR